MLFLLLVPQANTTPIRQKYLTWTQSFCIIIEKVFNIKKGNMVEQTKRHKLWTSLTRIEQFTLVGTVLIWVGVILFGAGLYFAFTHYQAEQEAYAQATAIALLATETATPSPTAVIYPVGWSTATPTPFPTPTFSSEPLLPSPTTTMTATNLIVPVSSATPQVTPAVLIGTEEPGSAASPTAVPEAEGRPPPSSFPPDRLVISSIGLDSSIIPVGWKVIEENGQRYSVWQVADYVVGWHKTSVYPGHLGNLVLSGHHNIQGEVFRYLVDVEIGAYVLVYAKDQVYYYQVTEKHILKEKGEPADVRRQNATWIASTPDERLTMVTCWPYTNNTHRLVVVAKPVLAPQVDGLEK